MDYRKVIEKSGESVETISSRRLAQLLGCGKTKALQILRSFRDGKEPQSSFKKMTESNEISGNKWDIHLPSTRICTLEQLIEHAKVDMTVWECSKFTANKWEMGAVDPATGQIVVEPLFQIKATFVKSEQMSMDAVKAEIEALKAEAKRLIKTPALKKQASKPSGNCLEVSVFDPHLGKLAWGDETLWGNYDLAIAASDYDAAVDKILERCTIPVEEILFIVGNDLMHVDNPENTTTKGTRLDADGRFHKVFGRTRKVITAQIEKLRRVPGVKKVMVYIVPGNHDRLSTWHLGDSIECLYNNASDVEVVNDPSSRKYYQWGENLLMFCHGDEGKRDKYPLVMATERPEMWANSKFREVHTGHIHTDTVKEIMGVKLRSLPALSATDQWHSANCYIGNLRGAKGFIYNKTEGLISTIEYTVPSVV